MDDKPHGGFKALSFLLDVIKLNKSDTSACQLWRGKMKFNRWQKAFACCLPSNPYPGAASDDSRRNFHFSTRKVAMKVEGKNKRRSGTELITPSSEQRAQKLNSLAKPQSSALVLFASSEFAIKSSLLVVLVSTRCSR
jgi:hypothetical protein